MNQYISTLRHEVGIQGVNIAELKLGHFNIPQTSISSSAHPSINSDNKRETSISASDDLISSSSVSTLRFHRPSRAELTKQRLQASTPTKGGTSLRKLHNAVFDVVERRYGIGGTTFVGRGARTYDLVGRWAPDGLVSWMMATSSTKARDRGTHTGKKERVGSIDVEIKKGVSGRSSKVDEPDDTAAAAGAGSDAAVASSEGSLEWEKVDERARSGSGSSSS